MTRLNWLSPQVYRDWLLSLTIRPTAPRLRTRRSGALIVAGAIVILTGAFGSRFYNEPRLAPGVQAPETLLAPYNLAVTDAAKTEDRQDAALKNALIHYRVNQRITEQIEARLSERLIEASTLRQIAGPFPFYATDVISTSAQAQLRSLESDAYGKVIAALEKPSPKQPNSVKLDNQIWRSLLTVRAKEAEWKTFKATGRAARQRYQTALGSSSFPLDEKTKLEVLNLKDSEWTIVVPSFRAVVKRIVTQGISPGLSHSRLSDTVKSHFDSEPPAIQSLAQTLLLPVLEPNLENDPIGIALERKRIIETVQPVLINVKKGEVIVDKGQIITEQKFQVLEEYKLSRRGLNFRGLGLTSLAVGAAVFLFHLVHTQKTQIPLSRRDYVLLVILAASAPIIAAFSQLEFTSLPAVALLVGSLYGSVIGGTTVVLITALIALGLDTGFAQLLAIAAGSFVGSLLARQPRSREELALLGLIIAVLQGVLYFIFLSVTGSLGYGILMTAVRQGVLGLTWSIATLGISPYIEKLFDLVTPIRLSELANPNRPLLKRLAMETPGTFQHTLFVATLAEAGARALNCNVELVRTGTLYHDIGKMHYPKAFIENQFGCENVHDQLDDPWASAEIIKKHVSEGLVMARKYHLPSAVAAFIPEHQGTILVAFFHHQAQQKSVESEMDIAVQEEDFRYVGPIPQSRETGIVMLADACEAALRSLKEINPDLALNTINKIFKARWKDEQLSQSHLSRDDLKVLAQVFVEVWQQFNHQRITYPSQLSTGN